jgi:hypothetical protein
MSESRTMQETQKSAKQGGILLENTLTNRKEAFAPLHPGEVRMYTCGPTVYDGASCARAATT